MTRLNQKQCRLSVCLNTLTASMFPAPPLKFRTSGFPQYGFKCGFGCDLHHRNNRLNQALICPATLRLIHIFRLSSRFLLFCPLLGFRQFGLPPLLDNHPSPRDPLLRQGYVVLIIIASTASSASLYSSL